MDGRDRTLPMNWFATPRSAWRIWQQRRAISSWPTWWQVEVSAVCLKTEASSQAAKVRRYLDGLVLVIAVKWMRSDSAEPKPHWWAIRVDAEASGLKEFAGAGYALHGHPVHHTRSGHCPESAAQSSCAHMAVQADRLQGERLVEVFQDPGDHVGDLGVPPSGCAR